MEGLMCSRAQLNRKQERRVGGGSRLDRVNTCWWDFNQSLLHEHIYVHITYMMQVLKATLRANKEGLIPVLGRNKFVYAGKLRYRSGYGDSIMVYKDSIRLTLYSPYQNRARACINIIFQAK